MDQVFNVLRFLADIHIGYINMFISLFSFIGINNPLFGIWIAQLPLYAVGFTRVWRISFRESLFSFPNIFYTTIMSVFTLSFSEDWTKLSPFISVWFILTFYSLISVAGRERIRGRTIQRELDRKFRD